MLRVVVTNDEADQQLLSLANEKGKFAIQLGMVLEPELQQAFERGIDNRWFDLVDIGHVQCAPGRLMKVFRLTDAGAARLNELR